MTAKKKVPDGDDVKCSQLIVFKSTIIYFILIKNYFLLEQQNNTEFQNDIITYFKINLK